MELDLKKPCKDCPFRHDKLNQFGWLGEERAEDIINTLYHNDQSFTCHKTTHLPSKRQQHCAGAMILLEREERANQWMRIMERLGQYDRTQLEMNAPVFETPQHFIDWHGGSEEVMEYYQRQAARNAREAELTALHEGDTQEQDKKPDTAQWAAKKENQMDNFLKKLEDQGIERASFGLSQ